MNGDTGSYSFRWEFFFLSPIIQFFHFFFLKSRDVHLKTLFFISKNDNFQIHFNICLSRAFTYSKLGSLHTRIVSEMPKANLRWWCHPQVQRSDRRRGTTFRVHRTWTVFGASSLVPCAQRRRSEGTRPGPDHWAWCTVAQNDRGAEVLQFFVKLRFFWGNSEFSSCWMELVWSVESLCYVR